MSRGREERVCAKRLLLTWAGLYEGELTIERVRERLEEAARSRNTSLVEWAIGRERHEDPRIPGREVHFHAYTWFHDRVEISNRRRTQLFDIELLSGRPPPHGGHPEIVSIGSCATDRQRVINYVLKDGDCDSRLLVAPDPHYPVGGRTPAWARRLHDATSVDEAMHRIWLEAPHMYARFGDRLRANLTVALGGSNVPRFNLQAFCRQRLDFSTKKVILISGPSRCGKTQYALAHFRRPLEVHQRDDLKRISFVTDGIILDDVDLTSWTSTDIIALFSIEQARSVRCRNEDAHIPIDLPIVATTNRTPEEWLPSARLEEEARAITNRLLVFFVTAPLYREYRRMPPPRPA